ncbi:MAG: flagellar motor protein [Gammaproteobacteria bacterium]
MDPLSATGLVLALVAVVGGSILKGSGLAALWNGAAFVIVVVGTFASSLIQTPRPTFVRAMKIFSWVFKPPASDLKGLIEKVVEWSNLARKQGLLALEPALESEADPFAKKALQMLVDGTEPESIRKIMEVELEAREIADTQSAKVFEGLGIYAPTLGIIGAVMGLMAVMKNLADPSKLGSGIAAAFVATIYGIGLANLLFLPAANKLKEVVKSQTQVKEILLEGVIAIAEGENPRNIEVKLQGYLS